MRAIGPIIAGLEVGLSKCCLACAEADPRGFLNLLAIVERRFRLEANYDNPARSQAPVIQAVKHLVQELAAQYQIAVTEVQLSVNGTNVIGQKVKTFEDSSIPANAVVLHRFGSAGTEVAWWDFAVGHIIHGREMDIWNDVGCVTRAGLRVKSLVFAGLASAYAVLRPAERMPRSGSKVVADIGASGINYIEVNGFEIQSCKFIPGGTGAIIAAIATALRISWEEAESKMITGNDNPDQQKIITSALIEMFCSIHQPGRRAGSVYVTGGGSKFPGVELLGANVLNRPVYQTLATGFAGAIELIRPEHSTALGLIKYAAEEDARRRLTSRMNNSFTEKIDPSDGSAGELRS